MTMSFTIVKIIEIHLLLLNRLQKMKECKVHVEKKKGIHG